MIKQTLPISCGFLTGEKNFINFVIIVKMCFKTNKCCCGCTDQKTGVIIWTIFDILLSLLIAVTVTVKSEEFNLFSYGFFVAIFDIILLIGIFKSIDLLMIVWLSFKILDIILCYIFGTFAVVQGSIFGGTYVPNYQVYIAFVIEICLGIVYITMGSVGVYFWVVVNSLRKNIIEQPTLPSVIDPNYSNTSDVNVLQQNLGIQNVAFSPHLGVQSQPHSGVMSNPQPYPFTNENMTSNPKNTPGANVAEQNPGLQNSVASNPEFGVQNQPLPGVMSNPPPYSFTNENVTSNPPME